MRNKNIWIGIGLVAAIALVAVLAMVLPTRIASPASDAPALAMVILSTPSLMYYMAVLMVAGLITGAVTGVAANLVMKHLAKIRR